MASQGATVQSEILKVGWGGRWVTATDIQEHKEQIQVLQISPFQKGMGSTKDPGTQQSESCLGRSHDSTPGCLAPQAGNGGRRL